MRQHGSGVLWPPVAWGWQVFALYWGVSFSVALIDGLSFDWWFMLLVWLVLWGGLILVGAISMRMLVAQTAAQQRILTLGLLLLSCTVPHTTEQFTRGLRTNHWDFRLRAPIYQVLVTTIMDGRLTANAQGEVVLGPWGGLLSEDGAVTVEQRATVTTIIFYRSRGFMGEFSGYIYHSDRTALDRCDVSTPMLPAPSPWYYCIDA